MRPLRTSWNRSLDRIQGDDHVHLPVNTDHLASGILSSLEQRDRNLIHDRRGDDTVSVTGQELLGVVQEFKFDVHGAGKAQDRSIRPEVNTLARARQRLFV